MAGLFEALGDPVRRLILESLVDGEARAGEIGAAVRPHAPISQPAVSQHLKVLRGAGLVTARPEGTSRIYAIDRRGLTEAMSYLARLTDGGPFFAQPLDALETEVARGKAARGKRRRSQQGGTGRASRTG